MQRDARMRDACMRDACMHDSSDAQVIIALVPRRVSSIIVTGIVTEQHRCARHVSSMSITGGGDCALQLGSEEAELRAVFFCAGQTVA